MVQWVPIIPTLTMQGLLVVLHSKYSAHSALRCTNFMVSAVVKMMPPPFSAEVLPVAHSSVRRVGETTISSGKPPVSTTPVSASLFSVTLDSALSQVGSDFSGSIKSCCGPGKAAAAADPNAAWAAYYAQYYNQQPGGGMPGQAPGAAAAPADQGQAVQASGGQPDYTKAWEEYYKKMGMSTSCLWP